MECFNFMGNILGKLCSTTKQNVTNVYIDNDNNDSDCSHCSNCTEADFNSCHSDNKENEKEIIKLYKLEIDVIPIDNGFKVVFDKR